MGRTLSTDTDAEVLITAQVSEDFFSLMRVPPLLGRTFSEEETRRAQFNNAAAPTGADPVVILSHGVWRQRFGSDPDIVGRTVTLERRPFRVVGVMPDGFAMPDRGVQLWIPWDISGDRPRDQHYLGAIARLKPGVSIAQADEQLNGVARELGLEHPATNRGWGVRISSLRDRDGRRHGDRAVGAAGAPSASCCWWRAPTSRCCRSCAGWIDRMKRPCAWRLARRPAACSASS